MTLLLACHLGGPARELVARHPDTPALVAHRGASAEAPENTLAAYRTAITRGFTAAETDVHLSRDGRVVVMHDPTIRRTTDRYGAIAELDWDVLRLADAGSWFGPAFAGERIPELEELLDLVRGKLVLCVEVKAGEGIAEAIRERVDARDMRASIVIFSFLPQQIAAAKAAMPDVPAVLLTSRTDSTPDAIDRALAVGADAVGFDHRVLAAELVEGAHTKGLPVFTWTVDEMADAARVRSLGVDAIISNQPDRI